MLYVPGGWGSVLTQHHPLDTETDGQCNTHNRSLGPPGALLQISYFTANLQYTIFYNIILGLGKAKNSQDRFLVIHSLPRFRIIHALDSGKLNQYFLQNLIQFLHFFVLQFLRY
jgi:hypothetical protein